MRVRRSASKPPVQLSATDKRFLPHHQIHSHDFFQAFALGGIDVIAECQFDFVAKFGQPCFRLRSVAARARKMNFDRSLARLEWWWSGFVNGR